MKHIIDLIKNEFDLWCRMRWLKTINKEIDKRDKFYEEYKRKNYVISELVKEYNKRYSDAPLTKESKQ